MLIMKNYIQLDYAGSLRSRPRHKYMHVISHSNDFKLIQMEMKLTLSIIRYVNTIKTRSFRRCINRTIHSGAINCLDLFY